MITRRALLAAGAVPLLAALSPPPSGRLAFRIVRKGDQIGTHVLTFTSQPDGLDVRITVDIAVRFGPIVLFRYTLRGLEQWRGGQVARLVVNTNDDGASLQMQAVRNGGGLMVDGPGLAPYFAPANALPATHWNMAELDVPWINPQNGRLLQPKVLRRGPETVRLANGSMVTANRTTLSGDADLDLWYDASAQWTALRFTAKDGSAVNYERM